ncbi:DUF6338 family protein [Paenibacillus sp. FSL K6-2524]|uniref:DUF6338 family protein n=1 Tax=Paenibacillus sp. FSL K6-2524 TaxID=2954516 RepID=UPI0030FA8AF7
MEVTADTIIYIAMFIVPGFIMSSAYSGLVPQRVIGEQSAILRFISFSFLNAVIWFWLINDLIDKRYWDKHPVLWIFILFGVLCISPLFLGFFYGVITAKEWIRKLVGYIGINPVHPIPTAWDYVMSSGNWVMITLKDDSIFYGVYSSDSFASSVPEERDIYLEKVYTPNPESGEWQLNVRTKGVWIPKEELRYIEFIQFEKVGE